jgi:hypothetical protein
MVLTVLLHWLVYVFTYSDGEPYTMVPENTPARQRNKMICHIDLLKPNRQVMMETPTTE